MQDDLKPGEDRCEHCGQMLPQWTDIAAALDSALTTWAIPDGVRPMLIQAAREIRELRRNQPSPDELK